MSDAQREVLQGLMDSVYDNLTTKLAVDRGVGANSGRQFTPADVEAMLDAAYYNPRHLAEQVRGRGGCRGSESAR
jgi:hypothetical protein